MNPAPFLLLALTLQQTPLPPAQHQRVIVTLDRQAEEIRGRLDRIDEQSLTLRRHALTIDVKLADVRTIELQRRDSLVNGPIFGALAGTLLSVILPVNAFGDNASRGKGTLGLAVTGALVGGLIDLARGERRTLIWQR